jgi:hypothetical protein
MMHFGHSTVVTLADLFGKQATVVTPAVSGLVSSVDSVSIIDEDPLARLDNLAYELAARSLREYGNQLSAPHSDVLLNAAIVFGLLASGNITGRYVCTLPPGMGKTRLMISWTKAMVALEFPWTIAICAERVEELEAIWKELQEGECPVQESELAIWHSKPYAKIKPTFTPEEARAGVAPPPVSERPGRAGDRLADHVRPTCRDRHACICSY